MPENVAPRSGAPAGASGGRGKGAYQDRDKPAQIRFSNISAAKGITSPFQSQAWSSRRNMGSSSAFSPWTWVGMARFLLFQGGRRDSFCVGVFFVFF